MTERRRVVVFRIKWYLEHPDLWENQDFFVDRSGTSVKVFKRHVKTPGAAYKRPFKAPG